MHRERYDEYIRRFNAEDGTAFDDFIAEGMRMQNGHLVYHGVQGMKDHYARIWGHIDETITVERYVSDETNAAVRMWTHFDVLHDAGGSPFGPVRAGEQFDYRGVVMYEIEGGQFTDIRVAYNSFTFTDLDGVAHELGIPH